MKHFTLGLLVGLILSGLLFAAPLISIDLMSQDNATRVITAFCSVYNYQEKVRDEKWVPAAGQTENDRPLIDNPRTKGQFTKAQVLKYVKAVVKQYESSLAVDAARKAAEAKTDSEVEIN